MTGQADYMKSLISSSQVDNRLSQIHLSFRERDQLFEKLHISLEHISRTSAKESQQFPVKIDSLQIVLDLEIDATTILIKEVRVFNECF